MYAYLVGSAILTQIYKLKLNKYVEWIATHAYNILLYFNTKVGIVKINVIYVLSCSRKLF